MAVFFSREINVTFSNSVKLFRMRIHAHEPSTLGDFRRFLTGDPNIRVYGLSEVASYISGPSGTALTCPSALGRRAWAKEAQVISALVMA